MVLDYRIRQKQIVVDEAASYNYTYKYVCEKYKHISHVITEVTYGFNAHMIFEKTVTDDHKKQEVGGSLKVLINALPDITIDAEAKVDITEEQKNASNGLNFKFYGDAIVDPPPSTYIDALKVNLYIMNYS